ncbi:hypothetical protein Rhow_008099 [Rhodococcus wratislaviensis]|uniref:Lsr2 DNA-binding domain-containing protein n=1 Tax=Rhodococcus wratislaviensis TaxID=44752 RepID=A0A402CJJ6_RHOWR|nr:histone-like nucleoid-structuring protein Lsr2 [Rhodococcus wratislaviensis]GCE43801.1 hypothetical protein Rhow_008099 [Rhodococcus wratislaviensis]
MMISLQVAVAAVAGYWLGRAYPTKPGMALAVTSSGPVVGSPQEMVDDTTNLLEASPEFAALDESARGQLLDAVRVAAMAAVTARIEAAGEVAAAADEAPLTSHESVENIPDATGQVAADSTDTAGPVADTTDTAGPVADGNETTATATDAGDRGFDVAHARRRRSHAPSTSAPTADTSEHGAQPDTGAAEDTDNGTTAALADDAPAADAGNTAASTPSTAEVRAWAHATGFTVSDRGRLSTEIWEAHAASPTPPTAEVRAWAHTHRLYRLGPRATERRGPGGLRRRPPRALRLRGPVMCVSRGTPATTAAQQCRSICARRRREVCRDQRSRHQRISPVQSRTSNSTEVTLVQLNSVTARAR